MDRITGYDQDITRLKHEISSKNFYKRDELPPDVAEKFYQEEVDPTTGNVNKVPEEFIPADKVAPILMQRSIKALDEKYMSGLSPVDRDKFLKETRTRRYGAVSDIIEHTYKTKAGRLKADTEVSFNRCIDLGDEECARRIADTALAENIWTPGEWQVKSETIGSEVDYQMARKVVETGGIDELERVRAALLAGGHRINKSSTDRLLSRIDSRLDSIERKRDKSLQKWRENNEMEYTEAINRGDLTLDDVYALRNKVTPAGFRRLEQAVIRRQRGKTPQVDETLLRNLQVKASQVAFPPPGSSVEEQARYTLAHAQKAYVQGSINLEQYETIKNMVAENRDITYNTQAYKKTEKLIAQEFGSSVTGIMALLQASQMGADYEDMDITPSQRATIQAIEDLQMQVRLKGANFDPQQWWIGNRDRYSKTEAVKKGAERYRTRFDDAIFNPDGSINVEETRRNILKLEQQGVYDRAERWRRLRILNGDESSKWKW